jgi:predicted nucleotide-binding protein
MGLRQGNGVMNEAVNAFAKLAGVLKAANALLTLVWNPGRNERALSDFAPKDAEAYFVQAARQLKILRHQLPALYEDFPAIDTQPEVKMGPIVSDRINYSRRQVEALIRSINQIFEIRSHSELATPETVSVPRVFISHGQAADWREVQSYIERDIGLGTLELAQEPNLGRTVIEKLQEESGKCTSAVIVMTGDDIDASGTARARENVLHEIGYFQAKFGLSGVCLLHEDGTNIPSNIYGLVYIPFTKGVISMTLGLLTRELKAFYKL